MNKTLKKILCAVLVLMMTIPFMAFPAGATPAEDYAAANDGDLLQTVNFKADYWSTEFVDDNNCGAEYEISEDGTAAKLKLTTESYRRAMWGGIAEEDRFPLRDENGNNYKYTIKFDLKFGAVLYNKYAVGIQVDGNNTLLIDGFGLSYMYRWNDQKVNKSEEGDYKWNYHTDIPKENTHTFAVEVDPETNEMTLYVADADGTFAKVRTMTYDGAELGNTLSCKIYTRCMGSNQPDEKFWSEVSNVEIYKGLVGASLVGPIVSVEPDNSDDEYAEPNIAAPEVAPADTYANAEDKALLQTVNFNDEQWTKKFVDKNNCGADVVISEDGTSAKLTVLEESYQRAMWGGINTKYRFPINESAKYTYVFDAQFGNADVGVGIITDSTNTLVIKGDGNTNWYAWNTYKVGSSDNSSERWDMCTDVAKTDKQTFAVEFDLENTTMTLYVKQSDGTFKFVREVMCYDTEFGELLSSRIGIRNTKTKNTPDETYWAEISNLSIYKGLVYYDVVERVVDDTDEEEDEDNGGSATKPNNNKTETKAPETTAAPETEAEVKSGCGSSVAMTGVALVGTCVAMLAVKRRRED